MGNNKNKTRRKGRGRGRRKWSGGQLILKGVGQAQSASVHLAYRARFGDTLDVGNSYIFYQEMRGNGAYDPDYTGVGAQPWGFDQYAALYDSYWCRGSSITVTFYTRTAATTNSSLIGYILPSRAALTVSRGALNIMNMPYAKHCFFDGYHNQKKLTSRATNVMVYPGLNIGNNNFQAATTANPAFGWVWTVGIDGNSVAADTLVDVLIEVFYDLVFVNPIELTAS